ncbi:hypothetical protein B1B_17841 [mine drainage metagenome]|uniref:PIN domain-containing protein n=1 Tax=mine drainage metagenome TaxID=410659 RepID=T0YG59_9ZZZZ
MHQHHDPEKMVLDTSAILSRRFDMSSSQFYVTSSILNEIEKGKISRYLKMAELSMNVIDPESSSVAKVIDAARTTGDIDRLSNTDIDAIALALQIGAVLVTDDYSMQNISKILGIKSTSATIKEIGKVIEWVYRCTGCGRIYEKNIGTCVICGHVLKNYPRSTRKIHQPSGKSGGSG